MKRDLDLVRELLLKAERSEDRWFDIGRIEWTDHDMRDKELLSSLSQSELYHLDLMEQGGLIRKTVCEHSEVQMWEITWNGFEFLDAVRSEKIWARLKARAADEGVALTVQSAISLAKSLVTEVLSVSPAS